MRANVKTLHLDMLRLKVKLSRSFMESDKELITDNKRIRKLNKLVTSLTRKGNKKESNCEP